MSKRTFTNAHTGNAYTEQEVVVQARRAAKALRGWANEAEEYARKVENGTVTTDNDFLDLTDGGLDESNPPFVMMDEEE